MKREMPKHTLTWQTQDVKGHRQPYDAMYQKGLEFIRVNEIRRNFNFDLAMLCGTTHGKLN